MPTTYEFKHSKEIRDLELEDNSYESEKVDINYCKSNVNYRCRKCGQEFEVIGDYYKDGNGTLRCPVDDCYGVVDAVW